ncbi:hypothetical protein [Ectobacillus ponti]|uniref:LysM domain-containing protein n=1 Tax=Ectobacillus ponti TaxID=2961894 RepID=A0AA41X4Q0_9BACI|nr:hypothetical protein [Ectobacillus ponti]MCP8967143.1 hypothetical protein [Ectobacillus ponti]
MMKRLGMTLCVLLVGYIIFYDMTVGTLKLLHTFPQAKPTSASVEEAAAAPEQKTEKTDAQTDFKPVEIKSGDTVLSVTEAINKKKPPAIDKIVEDFRRLNPNESPTKLRIGKTYKFPLYK